MDSTHEAFLLHTSVHCIEMNLSKLRFEVKGETKIFSEMKANQSLSYSCVKIWLKSLAYWAALLGKLNNLNLKLQGKVTNIIQFRDESGSILFEFTKLGS